MYERLTDGDDTDLTGLVAYALYKQNKRAWITDRLERNSLYPSPQQVDEHVQSYTDMQISMFRDRARETLFQFADRLLEQNTESIKQEARGEAIVQEVKRQGGFWRTVGVNAMAGAVIGLAVVVIYVLAYSNPNIRDFFERHSPTTQVVQ
ncbi:hypothetical protein D3874_06925 [Oleomonas cavernae]|uniref:Uncharacterized protein n=2 Tax=Oleomonas cavernae TaxID=2320859 RepID=A0A418W9T7_9PROT|nr:hypothetical protein D3874_06925 [Oleomonas cavernae]